jgi:integrase
MARGSIRRRSKVRKDSWTVQFYLGLDPVTGKKRYYSEAVRGAWEQADQRRVELSREFANGSFAAPSSSTVAEYLEEWLRDHAGVRVRQRTLEGYQGSVRRYILPRIGNLPLRQLSARHVQEMESALLRGGGSQGRGLSPRTVLHAHRVLSSALRTAERLGLVERNAAGTVDPPRVVRREMRTLAWDDVHRLLDQISHPLFLFLVLLAIQTGLRRSELLGLQWRDVNLDARTLSVRRALVKLPSGGTELNVPKNGRGRVVDLPVESVEFLSARHPGGSGGGGFLFCDANGNPVDPDFVSKTFKRLARESGLGYLRFHDLRHTHASLLLEANIHLKVVSERLGHSSVAITGDLYSHVLPSVQREAVERFGEAWSAGVGAGMVKEWQIEPEVPV